MRVKQIENALDLFECFGRDGQPMTLTAIATALAVPKSSAFNIIETLVHRGYLYETRPRGGYYPTALLSEVARAIADADPLVQRLHPELVALAAATGETALLSSRQHHEIVYLDVVESTYSIRYFARIGHRRALHTTSSGKAILSSYPPRERATILTELGRANESEGLPLDLVALDSELEVCLARGWTEDLGGTQPDVAGYGVPLQIHRRSFGLAVAGPLYRMQDARERVVAELLETRSKIISLFTGPEATTQVNSLSG